jgi:hypothetical protein
MTCSCAGPCRFPIAHAQPTVDNIELPPYAEKVGDKPKTQFTARDRRAMDRFKP